MADTQHDWRFTWRPGFELSCSLSTGRINLSPEAQRFIYQNYVESEDPEEVTEQLVLFLRVERRKITEPVTRAILRRITEEMKDLENKTKFQQDHWNFVMTPQTNLTADEAQLAVATLVKWVTHGPGAGGNGFEIRCSLKRGRSSSNRFLEFNQDHQAFICNATEFEFLSSDDTARLLLSWDRKLFPGPGHGVNVRQVARYIKHQQRSSLPGTTEAEYWNHVRRPRNDLRANIRSLALKHGIEQRLPPHALPQHADQDPSSSQKWRAEHALSSGSSDSWPSSARASSSSLEPKKEKDLKELGAKHERQYQGGFKEAYARGGTPEALNATFDLVPRQENEMERRSDDWKKKIGAQKSRRQENERLVQEAREQKTRERSDRGERQERSRIARGSMVEEQFPSSPGENDDSGLRDRLIRVAWSYAFQITSIWDEAHEKGGTPKALQAADSLLMDLVGRLLEFSPHIHQAGLSQLEEQWLHDALMDSVKSHMASLDTAYRREDFEPVSQGPNATEALFLGQLVDDHQRIIDNYLSRYTEPSRGQPRSDSRDPSRSKHSSREKPRREQEGQAGRREVESTRQGSRSQGKKKESDIRKRR
ncbi:MAG: hypothetical protein Q9195_009173 [Heterodermia aff. obscurata]